MFPALLLEHKTQVETYSSSAEGDQGTDDEVTWAMKLQFRRRRAITPLCYEKHSMRRGRGAEKTMR